MNALTPEATAASLLTAQRAAHGADPTPDRAIRIDRLDRLSRLLDEHAADFVQAISQDFGNRSAHETLLAEVGVLSTSIVATKRHLKG